MEQIDNLATHVEASNLKVGNRIRSATGVPAVSAVTQLLIDANSNLTTSVPATISQPTITGEIINMTGTPNGNIMTQTLVAGASATTLTISGFFRVAVVSGNDAIFSTSAYYVPLYTLV